MHRIYFYGMTIMIVSVYATTSSALASTINVRPGLWEVTINTQSEMLPPELQHPVTYKSCITQQDIDNEKDDFLKGEEGMTCNNKITKKTKNGAAGTFHCTDGNDVQAGEFEYELSDREHSSGKITINMTMDGNTMTSHGSLKSHWISASCGDTP
jgi:hypothetical protein